MATVLRGPGGTVQVDPIGGANDGPEGWQSAVASMAGSIKSLVAAMNDQKEASVLKWERKKPTVRMETAEAYMHEMVALDNAFAELGVKTYRRRWGIFRPALEGRAKEAVEVELEKKSLMPETITSFTEDQFEALFKFATTYLETSIGLTLEKKAEIALASMAKVSMTEGSGPMGAEKLVADYKHSYLLELRARLVENT